VTRAELDAILAELEQDRPHPCGPDLPGRSPAMVALREELHGVAGRLAAVADGSSFGVLFRAPDGGLTEVEALIRLAGLDPTRATRLRVGTPAYNASLLFGSGERTGMIEASAGGSRVIIGVEHLTSGQRERLVRYIRAWCGTRGIQPPAPLVLAAAGPVTIPEFDGRTLISVRLPPLDERRPDLPYVLQATARRCGTELTAAFRLDALGLLLADPWPGGLAEVEGMFVRLFQHGLRDPVVVDSARVRSMRQTGAAARPDVNQLWPEVERLCAECDQLCLHLIGVPFFRPPAIPTQLMADPHPPLRFSRLVTWSYCKLKEEGWPNLRIIRTLPPETDVLKAVEQDVDYLRTLYQHWLDPTAGHLERGRVWFQQACGRENPDDGDLELCFGHLLDALRVGFLNLRDRLVQIESDPGREMLTAQWIERREIEWPEHRMKTLLQQVLLDLNRQDNLNALFNRIREDMRKEIARHLGAPDRREAAVRAWLEDLLTRVIRPPFPVTGRDLIPRGVPRERMEECIRHLQEVYHRDPGLTPEGLIRLALERFGAGT
jgi:hypothetical protein